MAIKKYITQDFIEGRLAQLEDEVKVQEWVGDFLAHEPIIASFIFSDDVSILTEEEKELYTYIVASIWATIARDHYESANLTAEQVSDIEDKNWNLFLEQKKDSFRKKLDAFYKDFPQEDLLSIIEDLLEVDLIDEPLSPEGRDLIFIKGKTFLDLLIAE